MIDYPGRGRIYLDYNATTPVDPRVAEVVLRYMVDIFGNASSVDHAFGDEASEAVSTAARHVASVVGCQPESIVFTSGSTESANIALRGFCNELRASGGRPARIALMPVEHPAVLETCQDLERLGGATLYWLDVDGRARLDLDQLNDVCKAGVDLVALMAANNEVGTIYPVRDAAAITHQHGGMILCDATQAAGKFPLEADAWGIDMLTLSAHKMYGPKGVGALVVGGGLKISGVATGGGQQGAIRPGTLNVPGIAGLGEASRLRAKEMPCDEPRHQELRDRLQALLATELPDLVINGDLDSRLAGTLHVSVPGIPNQAVIARVRDRLAMSTGSACSSGIEAPSHVLRAMGLDRPLLDGALRMSLGKFTTDEDVRVAAGLLVEAVTTVRAQVES